MFASARITARTLSRTPWFTATVLVTIALGIGTNATIFSIVNRVVFWPLPYRDADRLVWISTLNVERHQYSKSSGWDYAAWKAHDALFEGVEAYWDRPYTFTGTDQPEAVAGWQFTPTLFSTMGVPPALGRTFVREDGETGRDRVVVLSDALWRRRFDANPGVVGATVEIDGSSYAIAGVMPASFAHPYPNTQLWTPMVLTSSMLADRKQRAIRVIARLRDGVTRQRAEVELQAEAQQFARQFPDTHAGWTVAVRPIRDLYVGNVGPLLWVIQGTALVLLLIAASNVASLLVVRASARERETAVRLALGATPSHLWRQQSSEGLMLAALGAGGGLLVAVWGTQVLPALLATRLGSLPLPDTAAGWLDARVLVAIAAAALSIALMFGFMPLLKRPDALGGSLRSGGRGATTDRRAVVLRNAIVTVQIALSVALLVAAGLLVRSFMRLQDRSFGFETRGITTAQLVLPFDRYKSTGDSGRFLQQLVDGIAQLPGVQRAAAVNTLPLTGFNALRPYNLPGQPPQERMTEFRIVTPDYFAAMGIPVRRGRVFDDRDRIGAQDVVVINQAVARRLWPNTDPVGQVLMVADAFTPSPKVVIGVVGDTRHHDLARDPEPEVYRSAYQAYWPFFGLVVRADRAPDTLERAIRSVGARLDKSVPLSTFQPLGHLADTTWAWRRSSMAIVCVFAAAAGFLAFVGVYGVMAYSVAERSREIGVRMALGASPADIAARVLQHGAVLTCAGTAIGLTMSTALGGLLAALLFGVTPLDAATFAAVSLLAVVAGLTATAIPAFVAARVDPSAALAAD